MPTRPQVQAGDCIVAFSKADICSIKQEIEAKTGCVRVRVCVCPSVHMYI